MSSEELKLNSVSQTQDSFAREKLKSAAKSQIKNDFVMIFLFYLIRFAISAIVRYIFNLNSIPREENYMYPIMPYIASSYGSSGVIFLLEIFFYSPLEYSLSRAYLGLIEDKRVKFSMFATGYTEAWGKSILLSFFIWIFTILWSLLFVIPGIIKYYSYRMAFFILADNPELSAREALKKSEEMMKGRKMDLFVLDLSFIGWLFLVAITFGVASIYVAPYYGATQANFYKNLKEV